MVSSFLHLRIDLEPWMVLHQRTFQEILIQTQTKMGHQLHQQLPLPTKFFQYQVDQTEWHPGMDEKDYQVKGKLQYKTALSHINAGCPKKFRSFQMKYLT